MGEITRRDYFAAHAPEVPGWFKHDGDPAPAMPPSVADYEAASDRHRKEFGECPGGHFESSEWHDRRSAGADRLNRMAKACELDRKAWAAVCGRLCHHNEIAREVAWRWYWANMMLLQSTHEEV